MKILWCTIDRSHRIAQQFDIFRAAVKKVANVTELKKYPAGDRGANAWQLSHKLITEKIRVENVLLNHLSRNSDYDFIFCDAFFSYLLEKWEKVNVPCGIFIEDVHRQVPRKQINVAKRKGIPVIFHRFNFAFHKTHWNARRDFNCIWLPHSADVSVFKDRGKRTVKVLHAGVYPPAFYPSRFGAIQLLKSKPYFKLVRRPKEGGVRGKKWPIDDDYAKLLSSAKICVTGGSIFDAPVQKYAEIPASGALLMSNWFYDLGLYGFVDGENMVAYHVENVVKKVEKLLNNDKEIKRIAEAGRKLILENHTSDIRAKQFVNHICRIVGKSDEFPRVGNCSYQVNFRRAA